MSNIGLLSSVVGSLVNFLVDAQRQSFYVSRDCTAGKAEQGRSYIHFVRGSCTLHLNSADTFGHIAGGFFQLEQLGR